MDVSAGNFWKDSLKIEDFTLLYSDCKAAINPAEAAKIIGDLDEGMPGYDVKQYFGSQPNIFRDYDHLTIAREKATNATVGLLGSKWFNSPDVTYLYLWTAMLSEQARGSTLLRSIFFWQLSKAVQEKTVPPMIVTKTYNPMVFKAMAMLFSMIPGARFYPELGKTHQDPEMVALAKRVVALLCPKLEVKYDQAVVVGGQGVLAPNFFPEMLPSSGLPEIEELFHKNLTRNDQILMILEIPSTCADAVHLLLRRRRRKAAAMSM